MSGELERGEPFALWASFKNANIAIKQGESIIDSFTDLLASELKENKCRVTAHSKKRRMRKEDWLDRGAYRHFEIKHRKKYIGTVTILVSFWREEDERGEGLGKWDGWAMPKIYIGFDTCDFESDGEEGDNWDNKDLFIGGDGRLYDDGHFVMPPYVGAYDEYERECVSNIDYLFFCVPFCRVASHDDVDLELVKPLLHIVEAVRGNGEFTQSDAFAGGHAFDLTSIAKS